MGNSSSQIQELPSDETGDSDDDPVQSQQKLRSSPPVINKEKRKRKRAVSPGEDGKAEPKKRRRHATSPEIENHPTEETVKAMVDMESSKPSKSKKGGTMRSEQPSKATAIEEVDVALNEAEQQIPATLNDEPVERDVQDSGLPMTIANSLLKRSDGKVIKARKSRAGLEPQSVEQAPDQDHDALAPEGYTILQSKRRSVEPPAQEQALVRVDKPEADQRPRGTNVANKANNSRKRSRKAQPASPIDDVSHTVDHPQASEPSHVSRHDALKKRVAIVGVKSEDDHGSHRPVEQVVAGTGEQSIMEKRSRDSRNGEVYAGRERSNGPEADNALAANKSPESRMKSRKKRRQTTSAVSAERIIDSDSDADENTLDAVMPPSQRQLGTKKKTRLSTQSEPGLETAHERASSKPPRSRRQRKVYACPVSGCTQTHDRVARLQKHVEQAHPDEEMDLESLVAPRAHIRGSMTPSRPRRARPEEDKDGHATLPAVLNDGPEQGPWQPLEIAIAQAVFKSTCEAEQISSHELKARINKWSDVETFKQNMAEALPNRKPRSRRDFSQRHWHVGERGKWSPEEDQALRDAAIATPGQWAQVAKELERPSSDCAARWKNALQRAKTRQVGTWTLSEVDRLRAAVEECIEELQAMDELSDSEKEDREFLEANLNWNLIAEKLGNTREPRRCRVKWAEIRSKNAHAGGNEEETASSSRRRSEPMPLAPNNSRVQTAAKIVELKFGLGDLFDCMLEIYRSFEHPDSAAYDDEKSFWAKVTLMNQTSRFTTHYRRAAYYHLYEKAMHRNDVRDAPTMASCAGILAKWIKREAKSSDSELSRTFNQDPSSRILSTTRNRKKRSTLREEQPAEDQSQGRPRPSKMNQPARESEEAEAASGADAETDSNDAEDATGSDTDSNSGEHDFDTGITVDREHAEAVDIERDSDAEEEDRRNEEEVEVKEEEAETKDRELEPDAWGSEPGDEELEPELEPDDEVSEAELEDQGSQPEDEVSEPEPNDQEPDSESMLEDQESQPDITRSEPEDAETESDEERDADEKGDAVREVVADDEEESAKEDPSSSSSDEEESDSSSEEDDSDESSAAADDSDEETTQTLREPNGNHPARETTPSPVKNMTNMTNGTKKQAIQENEDSDTSSSDDSDVDEGTSIEAMMRLTESTKRQRFPR